MADYPCKKCGKTHDNLAKVRWCKGNRSGATETVAEQAPVIVARIEPVPESQLPDFSTPDSSPGPASPSPVLTMKTTPPAQDSSPNPMVLPSGEVVRPIVDLICNSLEKRLQQVEGTYKPGRPVPVSEQDRKSLSTLYGLVLDKHLPALWMKKWGLEVAALLLTLTVLVPKVFEYRAYWSSLAEKKKKEKKPEPDRPGLIARISGESGNGSDEFFREAYERAQAEGRSPS